MIHYHMTQTCSDMLADRIPVIGQVDLLPMSHHYFLWENFSAIGDKSAWP